MLFRNPTEQPKGAREVIDRIVNGMGESAAEARCGYDDWHDVVGRTHAAWLRKIKRNFVNPARAEEERLIAAPNALEQGLRRALADASLNGQREGYSIEYHFQEGLKLSVLRPPCALAWTDALFEGDAKDVIFVKTGSRDGHDTHVIMFYIV
jgi:hypothetical protein